MSLSDDPTTLETLPLTLDTSDGSIDPHRLRSTGPLDARELAIARAHGIPLAYDPLQIGWVTASCTDDFQAELANVMPIESSSTDAELQWQLEEQAHHLLRSAVRRQIPSREALERLWALPESIVRESGPKDRSEAHETLRALQSRAHVLIQEQFVTTSERARRRHVTLVEGHPYLLRPWRVEEAPVFRALLDDARVWRYLPDPRPDPFTDATAADLIALANGSDHHEVRAIERDGQVLGQIRLLFDGQYHSPHAKPGSEAEISYWLGADYWGQGIAGAVIPLFTLLALRRRPLESIFARVAERNLASRRALEHAGYRDEGDLSVVLSGEPATRTLRCFRSVYLDERPRRDDAPAKAGPRAPAALAGGLLTERGSGVPRA